MTVDELLALLASLGERTCEDTPGLSELDHALQCAALLARTCPGDVELQLAGLVHDVGHAFAPDPDGGPDDHARAGARRVRGLLGRRVAAVVGAHVAAKRYLVATDASYRSALSPESVRSLAAQGGALGPQAWKAFERSPYGRDAVVLRRADDGAKVPGRGVASLDRWEPVVRAHARRAAATLPPPSGTGR